MVLRYVNAVISHKYIPIYTYMANHSVSLFQNHIYVCVLVYIYLWLITTLLHLAYCFKSLRPQFTHSHLSSVISLISNQCIPSNKLQFKCAKNIT